MFSSEAFSTKVFDFMAAGIPIVASRTTIDEFYFGDGSIEFFEPGNVVDCAEKIVALHSNETRREELSRRGKEFVQMNNWRIKGESYLEIVNSLSLAGDKSRKSRQERA